MTWIARLFKIGIFGLLLGLMVIGIFVAIARGEIDSFEDLKASPNGQMIRIRAADGTVIQSLGPSFGRWLTINELPSEMKDAMVAVGVAETVLPEYQVIDQVDLAVLNLDGVNDVLQDRAGTDLTL